VFLKWKGLENDPEGDFYVRSGPTSIKLTTDSEKEFIRTRFGEEKGRLAKKVAPERIRP
jgi:hypothetical protein